MIMLERKRTERSGNPFFLMLIEGRESLRPVNGNQALLQKLVFALKNSTRQTDSLGWYKQDSTVGVILTEVGDGNNATMGAILAKITNALRSHLNAEQIANLEISIHRYPGEEHPPQRLEHRVLFPDLPSRASKDGLGRVLKRTIDIVVSGLLLVLLSPVFLLVALAVRLTSKGPILFKQKRVGQHGVSFTFLKFRSMRVNSDPHIHKEYVSRLILSQKTPNRTNGHEAEGVYKITTEGVYKITKDPRVTSVGRFLRKSSLDELPQLWNVFKGEMSLVGPRPPIPYEVERYDVWHRRRVLEAKPGITGLWQVTGRSKTSFDDMVRIDLRYVSNWSIWLDLKILLQTPRAVFTGDGAY